MIKISTDINQSKQLAKILPINTADMYWEDWKRDTKHITIPKVAGVITDKDLPAWSLSALLGVLPKRVEIVDNVYELSVYPYGLYYWNINNGNLCFESKDKDNLVDACYEIILKLHEFKML